MKKIIICMFAVAAFIFVGCKEKVANDATAEDAIVEMQTMLEAGETDSFNALVTKSQEVIEGLLNEGKTEEAEAYAQAVKDYLNSHAEEIKAVVGDDTTVSTVLDAIEALPTNLDETVEKIKDDLEGVSEDIKGDVEEALEKAKDDVQQAVEQAKEDAKAKAEEAVEQAKEDAKAKAEEAVEQAKEDAANKLKDALKK